jgi:holliday junction DNA helicase RuvB
LWSTDMIGNDNIKKQLLISNLAAMKRNKNMPHTLFSGAPGCGKTSMARYIAQEANVPFLSVIPDEMEGYKKVLGILEKLNHENYDNKGNRIGPVKPTILFFDEIHRMPLIGQELLGIAMENFVIESGKPNKYFWVPYFTIVGATTKAGKLSKPFRDRFKLQFTFEVYCIEDMFKIVKFHSEKKELLITDKGALEIAKRSRGTPRIAVGFIERVRDKVLIDHPENNTASLELVTQVFHDLGIDQRGFTITELKILKTLFQADQPIGLDNLSIITDEDKRTIRDAVEPFLIREGMMVISGKGRVITDEGKKYFKDRGEIPVKEEIDFNYERK